MLYAIKTMNSGIGNNIRKRLSLDAEPRTRSDWEDELHVPLGLDRLVNNFIVLDMELCEIKTVN